MVNEHIPLEKCEIAEKFAYRVEYNVDGLAESIHEHGQLQNGVAYEENGKYYVFIGVRRLLAAKKSYEKYGAPTEYLANLVNVSEAKKWRLAIEENVRRDGLSALDLISIMNRAPQSAYQGVVSDRMITEYNAVKGKIQKGEVNDFLAVEKMIDKHLTITQIAALIGKERYTLVVGAYLAIAGDFGRERMKGIDDIVRDFYDLTHPQLKEYLTKNNINKVIYGDELETPTETQTKQPSAERAAKERHASEDNTSMYSPRAVEVNEPETHEDVEPKEPAEEGEDTGVIEEAREIILVPREGGEFVCPHCGAKYTVKISQEQPWGGE